MHENQLEKLVKRAEDAAAVAEERLEQIQQLMKKFALEFEELNQFKAKFFKEQKKAIKKQLLKISEKAARKAARRSQTISQIKSELNNHDQT